MAAVNPPLDLRETAMDADYEVKVRRLGGRAVEAVCKPIKLSRIARAEAMFHNRSTPRLPEEPRPWEALEKRCENLDRAERRAKAAVRHLVKAMGGDHLLTLSYRENMGDLAEAKRDLARFIRLVRARYPEWKYVAVPERQQRGAWHFHLAVTGRQPIQYLRRCWYKALGASPDAEGADTPGQINVRAPVRRWSEGRGVLWSAAKLSAYLSKYIGKSFLENPSLGAKRYLPAKDIVRPVTTRYWIGAAGPAEAIAQAMGLAQRHNATHGWSIWMSGDGGVIFIAADIDQEVPF